MKEIQLGDFSRYVITLNCPVCGSTRYKERFETSSKREEGVIKVTFSGIRNECSDCGYVEIQSKVATEEFKRRMEAIVEMLKKQWREKNEQ